MNHSDQRKLLSALSHGAIFFSSTILSVAVPIAILFISDDPVVKDNARESLNFHINIYIYGAIFLILAFLFVGIPLLILLFLATIIMPIIAIVKVLSEPEHPYRYPFLFRLL